MLELKNVVSLVISNRNIGAEQFAKVFPEVLIDCSTSRNSDLSSGAVLVIVLWEMDQF